MRRATLVIALVTVRVILDVLGVVMAAWGAFCLGLALVFSLFGWVLRKLHALLVRLALTLDARLRG